MPAGRRLHAGGSWLSRAGRRWAAVATVAALFLLLAPRLRAYLTNASVHTYLAPLAPPVAGDRVLVLAPHPDDEVLGAGGYLAAAQAAGAALRVIVATSGDGFRRAASGLTRGADPRPADFLRLGIARQAETRTALRQLGLPAGDVVFLGFPDGGLSALWHGGYSARRPYTSPFTGRNHVPYRAAYRPGAPYDGAALEAELTDLITSFQPNLVVLPDPDDFNADHRATTEFALMALGGLGDLGPGGPRLLFYLIHHGAWPTPAGDRPGAFLVPPADLYRTGQIWRALSLSPALEARKRRAIASYRSQMAIRGSWLLGFDRRNELYELGGVRTLPDLPLGYSFPQGGLPAEAAFVPAVTPGGTGSVDPAAALVGSHLFVAGERLWVILSLRGVAPSGSDYRLSLRTVALSGQASARIDLTAQGLRLRAPAAPAATFASRGRLVAFSVPLTDLDGAALVYLTARSGRAGETAWTPWEMFRLAAPTGWRRHLRRRAGPSGPRCDGCDARYDAVAHAPGLRPAAERGHPPSRHRAYR